ncbi:MAG: malto-oligosyltrehalose trehalohydrolase [Gammaproteobacteria bacterium]|nr:malto-oligosyltrehalose trehalohydrolase [Gammaproteobacteria bacterium]
MSVRFSHAMPFGARMSDAGVCFRLWAPDAQNVTLMLEGTNERRLPMEPRPGGWFELTSDAARAGSRYRYALADGTRVPDPASRFQPDDVHGPSEVVDPAAFAWTVEDWPGRPWHEAVCYETHPGAFTPAGGHDGALEKLDRLCALGVTALELMPLSDFAGRCNWGYDGVLPFAPAASYGRPEDLKRLIDAAHARGLMVLLDVVYNHFGPSGNYLARYASGFFTGRYRTPWGEAIDFGRREVRDFFIHNALYWLEEYRFDGLRLDAVDQIHDPGPTHILDELAATVGEKITDRHVHLVLENDDNVADYLERDAGNRPCLYTAQWNDDFHHAAQLIATGEKDGYYADYAQNPVGALGRALAEGFVYQGEYSGFRDRPRGEPSGHLPPTAFVNFLQNHDQIGNRACGERLHMLATAARLRALYALLLLSPGVPLLFMGEEWAASAPFLFFCDFDRELNRAVRDGRRAEFKGFAAFAGEKARQSIPDPALADTFSRSRLDWEESAAPPHAEWLAFITRLIALRRKELVPLLERMHSGQAGLLGERALAVAWPFAEGKYWRIAANFGDTSVATMPRPGRIVHGGEAGGVLAPWSAQVTVDE